MTLNFPAKAMKVMMMWFKFDHYVALLLLLLLLLNFQLDKFSVEVLVCMGDCQVSGYSVVYISRTSHILVPISECLPK